MTNERGHENRRLRRQSVNQGNIGGDSCSLILIADYSAFQMFREDVDSASSQLVSHVTHHVIHTLIMCYAGDTGVIYGQANLSCHRLDS